MFALLSITYVLLALLIGGYSTYLLATMIPQDVLEEAGWSGRFAELYDGRFEHAGSASVDGTASGHVL